MRRILLVLILVGGTASPGAASRADVASAWDACEDTFCMPARTLPSPPRQDVAPPAAFPAKRAPEASVPCAALPAADDRCEAWHATYDASEGYGANNAYGIDFVLDVAATAERVFLTGASWDALSLTYDWLTVAYAATGGAPLWVARAAGDSDLHDMPWSIAASPDGATVYVAGGVDHEFSQYPTADGAGMVSALDASDGSVRWSRRIDSLGPSPLYDVVVHPDGSIYLTGSLFRDNLDYLVTALEPDGAISWSRAYDGPLRATDTPWALAVAGDTVLVAGGSVGLGQSFDYALLAYDRRTSAHRWTMRYDGVASGNDYAVAVGVSPDGAHAYVTGASLRNGGLLAIDVEWATMSIRVADGSRAWIGRELSRAGGINFGNAVAVAGDGSRVVVTGDMGEDVPRGGDDIYTVAYDAATGDVAWARRASGLPGWDCEAGRGATIAGSRVYVTGYSSNCATPVTSTYAYDLATGAQVWAARFDGATGDVNAGVEIARSPDGSRLYVVADTARYYDTTHPDYFSGGNYRDFTVLSYAP